MMMITEEKPTMISLYICAIYKRWGRPHNWKKGHIRIDFFQLFPLTLKNKIHFLYLVIQALLFCSLQCKHAFTPERTLPTFARPMRYIMPFIRLGHATIMHASCLNIVVLLAAYKILHQRLLLTYALYAKHLRSVRRSAKIQGGK